jgi:hypothetical protein
MGSEKNMVFPFPIHKKNRNGEGGKNIQGGMSYPDLGFYIGEPNGHFGKASIQLAYPVSMTLSEAKRRFNYQLDKMMSYHNSNAGNPFSIKDKGRYTLMYILLMISF